MKREQRRLKSTVMILFPLFLAAGFTTPATAQKAIELSNEQVENIVHVVQRHIRVGTTDETY